MPTWQFSRIYQPGNSEYWTWSQRADDGAVLNRAARTFDSFSSCVADAARHGYEPPPDMHLPDAVD